MTTEGRADPSPVDLLREAAASGDLHRFSRAARDLLGQAQGARALAAIRNSVDDARKRALGLKSVRVALLSSFSIEFVHDALVCHGFGEGLDVEIYQAGFGQYRQEILVPSSGLHAFTPDVTVLAVEGEQWIPSVYGDSLGSDASARDAEVERGLAEVESLARTFASHSQGLLLVHTLDAPRHLALGILDGKPSAGQREAISRFNAGLFEMSRRHPNLYVVDCAELVAEVGRERWYDARMAHYAKAPVSALGLQRLAGAYARFIRARVGRARKCLVVDLDNTLWGGVIGEDGLDGIRLGPQYPGSAFVEFQRAVADLGRRGVMLAIASKNNPADAWEAFDRHPGMVLRRDSFVASRIGWEPKSESLRAIAAELNISLEHIVFVDDNPAECEEVGRALPMVTTLLLPRAPERYAETLLRDGLFDALTFTDEDRRRGELYRQRKQADELLQSTGSLEDYYRSLEMRVIVEPVGASSAARASQMTQKTNQFNATTLRYSEGEMLARCERPDWSVLAVKVADRFGDHGIVGLVMAHEVDGDFEIDTFLLSCRVIGRTVETAMLSLVADEAASRGARRLVGRIVPTPKNVPVRDLFSRHGFQCAAGAQDEATTWTLDVSSGARIAFPEWLQLASAVDA